MRKAAAAAKGSLAPSPQPGPDGPFSAEPMRRTGSSERPPRAPSALSIRKDSPLPRNDGSIPGTPLRSNSRPVTTRTSSANTTVYTARNIGPSGKASLKPNIDAARQRLSSLPIATSVDDPDPDPTSSSPVESSSEASSSESSPAQSRIIRRPPRFQQNNNDGRSSFADDDDDEDPEPAFLLHRTQTQSDGSSSGTGPHDLSATLRGNPSVRDYAKRRERFHQSHTSDSSNSSAVMPFKGNSSDQGRSNAGPLSPRRTMELAGRNSGGKGKGYSRDSDGTPSMGSSFSDLDGTAFFPPSSHNVPFTPWQRVKGLANKIWRRRFGNPVGHGRSICQQDAGWYLG